MLNTFGKKYPAALAVFPLALIVLVSVNSLYVLVYVKTKVIRHLNHLYRISNLLKNSKAFNKLSTCNAL